MANGVLEGSTTAGRWTTWSWEAPDAMAAYLATAATLAWTGQMLEYFEGVFGPYPFPAYGANVDEDSVGYALETQTRSLFSRVAGEGTAAHELAHSWTRNAVSPQRWADIWLNEGWATYAATLWAEHRGTTTLHALRTRIGDEAFFALARQWVARHDDGTASTADFEALAEEVSGQDLGHFFDVWLHTTAKPTSW